MSASIVAIGYRCPNCKADVRTPIAGTNVSDRCYRFVWPYKEGKCCHFGEQLVISELQLLTIAGHAHTEATR